MSRRGRTCALTGARAPISFVFFLSIIYLRLYVVTPAQILNIMKNLFVPPSKYHPRSAPAHETLSYKLQVTSDKQISFTLRESMKLVHSERWIHSPIKLGHIPSLS